MRKKHLVSIAYSSGRGCQAFWLALLAVALRAPNSSAQESVAPEAEAPPSSAADEEAAQQPGEQQSGESPEGPSQAEPLKAGPSAASTPEPLGVEQQAVPASVDPDVLAQEMNAELAGDTLSPSEPPLPDPDAFDWVRFDSGEWFGGDLKEMRDRDVTFDSDKLDVFTEDWGDVIEFRSARQYLYVNNALEYFEGPARITQETVAVRTASGIQEFPRSQLLSIVATSSREIDRWSLKFSLAATARAGNTDSVDYNNYVHVRRQDRLTRGTLESTTNLGDVNGERTVQNWNGSLKADLFLHRYFYVTPAFGSGQHNYFQNLRFRGALGGGGGVHAIDKSWLSVDFEALGGYQYTEYISALPSEPVAFDDALLAFGTAIEWDITGDLDLDLDWRTYLVLTEMGRTYHNGSARFSMEITDIFDFDLSATLNRIEEPAAGDDGVVPASNDWTFTAGIGIELN